MAEDERGQVCITCIRRTQRVRKEKRKEAKERRDRKKRTIGDSCPTYCLFKDIQPMGIKTKKGEEAGAEIQLTWYFKAKYLRQE